MTIKDVMLRYASGASIKQVVSEAIERARADTTHAILEITHERALHRAVELDTRLEQGEDIGRLAGVPFLVKDNILTFGSRTTASSKMLENFEAPYQATVIEKLEAEGAVCIGKTNLDSFAHGGSTENSYFGATVNAHDASRVAGGSSGGSAAAVAAGIVPFALGTDTGGSIRQPASYNGVVGLKPTYGSVSRYGVVAMASSTDVVGPIATTAADARLVFDCMRGVDDRDSTTVEIAPLATPKTPLKIGVIQEGLGDGIDESVRKSVQHTIDRLRQAGHTVETVSVPSSKYALAVYYVVVPAELTSNLGRYDGIKFGSHEDGDDLMSVYANSRSAGFMDENKRRILIGNYVLSSGYYDAYYQKAQTVRTVIIDDYKKAFKDVDVLLSPTAPAPAFKLGANTADPLEMYMADILTVPASLAGLPAVSVPTGVTSDGLPVGVQFTGPAGRDGVVLTAAEVWEGVQRA